MPDTLIVLATIGSCFETGLNNLLLACSPARFKPDDVTLDDVFVVLDEPKPEQASRLLACNIANDQSDTRRGIVGAYNVGFARFLAEPQFQFLHILEDGVIPTAGYLRAMRRVLENHPKFGWVACGQLENDKAPFTPLCSLMTRECAEAVKGLDPLFAPCQFDDADLFMRCLQAGFTPFAVNHKVSHPVSRTSREGTLEDDWALVLDHRDKFQRRWQIPDSPLHQVPVHTCERCK